jgi:glycosyltransferase involved in cell wall biosynthesis
VRILHVITKIGLGGAERVAETLAITMRADGVESAVLAVARGSDDAVAAGLRTRLGAAGIEIVEGSTSSSNRMAAAAAARVIAHTIARLRPDLLHLHTEVPEFAYALARPMSRPVRSIPTVHTIHHAAYWTHWRSAGWLVRRGLVEAQPVAVSEAAREAYLRWSGMATPDCPVVVNGILLSDLPLRQAVIGEPRRLLFAGRFEPEKGIDVLLDALPLLRSTPDRFRLTIMGAGRMQELVDRRVSGSTWPIQMRTPSDRLDAQLADFDAMLLPSRAEGLSLTAAEALCVGLPALATRAEGLVEAFPDGYPGLCPPDDAVALAQLIDAFLTDPSPWLDRLEADRTWARRRYDSATMAQRYLEIYQRTIARRAGTG